MPFQARTEVTAFRFAAVAESTERCASDIRAGVLRMSYALKGKPAVVINTQPGGAVPPPPAPEPPAPPGQDPVQKLVAEGWKVTDWVFTAAGANTGQPAGFGLGAPYAGGAPPAPPPPANPIFEKLELSFEFPLFCRCVENGKCRAAKFRIGVSYDGNQHPVIKLERSDEADCANVAALVINKEVGLPATALDNTGKATYTFTSGVTCPCDKKDGTGEGGESGGGSRRGGKPAKRGGLEKKGRKRDEGRGDGSGSGGGTGSGSGSGSGTGSGSGSGSGGGAEDAPRECPLEVTVEYVFRTVL